MHSVSGIKVIDDYGNNNNSVLPVFQGIKDKALYDKVLRLRKTIEANAVATGEAKLEKTIIYFQIKPEGNHETIVGSDQSYGIVLQRSKGKGVEDNEQIDVVLEIVEDGVVKVVKTSSIDKEYATEYASLSGNMIKRILAAVTKADSEALYLVDYAALRQKVADPEASFKLKYEGRTLLVSKHNLGLQLDFATQVDENKGLVVTFNEFNRIPREKGFFYQNETPGFQDLPDEWKGVMTVVTRFILLP